MLTAKKSWKGAGRSLRLVAAAGLMMALALPGLAADERAVKSRVPPVYPELAKRMRISGIVKIEATVDADGKVTDAKTVSGSHSLSIAAEEAVRKWRFVPAAAESTVDVDVTFTIPQ